MAQCRARGAHSPSIAANSGSGSESTQVACLLRARQVGEVAVEAFGSSLLLTMDTRSTNCATLVGGISQKSRSNRRTFRGRRCEGASRRHKGDQAERESCGSRRSRSRTRRSSPLCRSTRPAHGTHTPGSMRARDRPARIAPPAARVAHGGALDGFAGGTIMKDQVAGWHQCPRYSFRLCTTQDMPKGRRSPVGTGQCAKGFL